MKALIGMSGGVDSSAAAYLLQQRGWECIGASMLLHQGSENCDTDDARSTAQRMGIPFHVFDFSQRFRELVMEDFSRCYRRGLTPNPCIRCNRELKFGLFLQKALELGCDLVATGHYARIHRLPNGRYCLQKAVDEAKDQSYFLCCLTQQQLRSACFPLGEFTKEQARTLALELGFLNARKRDSQDICFIPGGDYMAFLQQFTGETAQAGDFLDESGRVVGRHRGAAGYTIGQRKGLGLAMGAPVYVCSKDMAANTVTVGPNESLMHRSLLAAELNWMAFERLTQPLQCKAKIRSRMTEQPATVCPLEDGTVKVVFDEPQRAITPGQAVVFYDGDLVLGGGTITAAL